jgi:hypothetical protein
MFGATRWRSLLDAIMLLLSHFLLLNRTGFLDLLWMTELSVLH